MYTFLYFHYYRVDNGLEPWLVAEIFQDGIQWHSVLLDSTFLYIRSRLAVCNSVLPYIVVKNGCWMSECQGLILIITQCTSCVPHS